MSADDPLEGAPRELLAYLDSAARLATPALGIRPLDRAAAREQALAIRQIPLGQQLGLVPLEDANNSRPHCYITQGPATGMILLFNSGDGQPLRYGTLAAFVAALEQAVRNGIHIEAMQGGALCAIPDQAQLAVRLLAALSEPPREAEAAVETLLPLLDPDNLEVLTTLGSHRNFLIRESVALYLKQNPRVACEELAKLLAADQYGQVARPAAEAAKLIRRAKAAARGYK